MHIRQTLIRALALALTLLLVLGSTNPALAVQEAGMTVTKIDNDALDARLEQPIVAEPGEEAPYGDTDMVRVSILLEKKSTLEAGFSTTGITQNDAAMAYRETLRGGPGDSHRPDQPGPGREAGGPLEYDPGRQHHLCRPAVWPD